MPKLCTYGSNRSVGYPHPYGSRRGELSKRKDALCKIVASVMQRGAELEGFLTCGGDASRGGWVQPFLGEPGSRAWDTLHPGSPSIPASAAKSIKVTHNIPSRHVRKFLPTAI